MASKARTAAAAVRQRTLKNSIYCAGVGLHSGAKVKLTLQPAEPDSGIVFKRSDTAGGEVRAVWQNAIETPLCTTIVAEDGSRISTIEHLMSALVGCGIDNAFVELDGPEVPIMDGSAAPFVFLIECAGTREQEAPRRALRVLKSVECAEPHRACALEPSDGFSAHFDIDFGNTAVAQQEFSVNLSNGVYKNEISRARTFGFLDEIDKLRDMGLAQGGSLENAIVIDGDQILNEGGLRYDNEFVRHKILDSIGDLFLIGSPVIGRFRGHRAGHALTLRLLKMLFADSKAWEWCEMTEADLAPALGAGALQARAVAAPA